jgi:hypothetical protein
VAITRPLVEKGDLGFTVNEVEEKEGNLKRILRGTFNVPNCLTGDAGPGARLKRDANGKPMCEGTVEAPFVLALPTSAWESGEAVPATVYGHGLLGGAEEARYVADQVPGFIVVGTDGWGMSAQDVPNIASVLTSNFDNARSIPERLLQGVINHYTLGYALAGEMAEHPALQKDGAPLIDTANIQYSGGSQGGILGGTIMALAPNFKRGALVVGGANYSLMVWRSTSFEDVNNVWSLTHADTLEREILFSLFQSVFDFSDPMIYAETIRKQPFAGNEPKQLMLVEAIGDTQVANIATEIMARTYEMVLLSPSVTPVWGLTPATEPGSDLALLQVLTAQSSPLPPTANIPADSDNGAHGAVADSQAVRETLRLFLEEGVIQSACDGACDPD